MSSQTTEDKKTKSDCKVIIQTVVNIQHSLLTVLTIAWFSCVIISDILPACLQPEHHVRASRWTYF